MASNLGLRAVAKDNLAGAGQIDPIRIKGPGLRTPVMPSQPKSMTGAINAALGKWASQRLQATANTQHEAQLMDGAIAATQGESFEKLEVAGADKWALQGHRIMTAQTISASMAASQKQQIAQADYALEPDAFRAKQVAMLEEAVEGQDPRTARLIRENMTAQMPELVAAHTLEHTAFLEDQGYSALLRGIDIMSRDTQSLGALVSFAQGGEGSASAGLSEKRRLAAVSEGVVLAFTNDNPRAYDLLKVAGVFEEFTTEQLNRVENAETQYQTRLRTEYDETRFNAHRALETEIKQGGVDPDEAAERTMEIEANHGINVTDAEMKAAYSSAMDPYTTAGKTQIAVIGAAQARNDLPALAVATQDIIKFIESGNDPYAVGPVIPGGANKGDQAIGEMQVVPLTLADPGFGIKPSDGSMEDNARVGRDYWAMNVRRAGGDLEAAAIGYNAGPGNMDKWLKAGRNYDALPDKKQSVGYWAKFQARMKKMEVPTGAEAYNLAQSELARVNKAVDVEAWKRAGPILNGLDQELITGKIKEGPWLAARDAVLAEYGVLRDKAMVNHEIAVTNSIVTAQRTSAKAAHTDAERQRKAALADQLQLAMMPILAQYDVLLDNPAVSEDTRQKALVAVMEERNRLVQELGITVKDAGNAAARTKLFNSYTTSIPAHTKWTKEEAQIDLHIAQGNVGDLSSKELQRRAFKKETARRNKPHEEAFRKAGGGPEAEAAYYQAVNAEINTMYSDLGAVDPDMRDSESAIALRPLLDKDGNPDKDIVGMVERYNAMVQINPTVAQSYLTEKARVVVNAINQMAGQSGIIAQGVGDLSTSMVTKSAATGFAKAQETQVLIADAIADQLEFDDAHGWFQFQANLTGDVDVGDELLTLPSEQARANGVDTRDNYRMAVEKEVARLFRTTPSVQPHLLVDTAVENVKKNAAVIGGNFVQLDRNIKFEMFGGRANQFEKANLPHLAVLAYLQTEAVQAEHQFIGQFAPAERLPGVIQDVLSEGLFGMIGDIDEGLAIMERSTAVHRNVRPFQTFVDAQGHLYAQIEMPNGHLSERIELPLAAVGAAYMAANERQF